MPAKGTQEAGLGEPFFLGHEGAPASLKRRNSEAHKNCLRDVWLGTLTAYGKRKKSGRKKEHKLGPRLQSRTKGG